MTVGLAGTLDTRLWGRIDASGDCWLWSGSRSTTGYGHFWLNHKLVYVHRTVYELLVGPIVKGMEVDHLCRVRHCVNPDHMEIVDHATNTRRGYAPAMIANRTNVCRRGLHALEGANIYRVKAGTRLCRTCLYDRMNTARRAKRAAMVAA